MIHHRRRHASPLSHRALGIALAAVLLASACGSNTASLSPGATINLQPSASAVTSPAVGGQPTASTGPSAVSLPSLPAPSGTPAAVSPSPRLAGSLAPTTPVGSAGNSPATATLDWQPCATLFECATLEVPLDYANPGGQQISLALSRLLAADPLQRIGSLVINPGGPGGSGVEFLQSSGAALFSLALRNHFDLVGFDPRGVGASTPVECLNGPALDRLNALDPTPDTPAERDALVQGAKEFDQACIQNSGKLLAYMSTADAARDMDRIRAALGELKLTYFGFSYGTFLGTVYAGLFPTNIRAFVLDGAIDPAQTFDQRNQAQAEGFARALNAFLDDCKARPSCQFFNSGHPAEAFDRLMTQIDAKPLPATATGDPRPVGPGEAFTGVLFSLYSKSSWPVLARGLALAQSGDGSILLILADAYNERQPDGTYKNVAAANNAVNCLDYKVPTDVAAYDAMVPRLEKVAPRFGAAIAYSGLTCAFWPVHPAKDPGEITANGAPPLLVVGTTGDPATPYQWAVNLAKELRSGVLLTRKGEGHTAYGDSKCIQDNVDQYLISLKLPAANTTCGS